jgi:enoyl-[acyl-carrier protein] reductase II
VSNRICPALGIHYPIILGGLANIGTASLAAAVSRAGGLGLLGAGGWDGTELERQIKKTRALTKHAFGVNIPIHTPHAQRLFETVMGEGIKVVSTSAGDPRLWTPRLKENDIFVMHVVPTVAYAVKAEAAGVDAVVAEGSESGGRTGSDEISTLALIPQTVDAVECPVIGAGGIGDGRGVAAALALGAAGVQMGTVFLATEECEISQTFKEMLIAADATDAGLFREGASARRFLKEEYQQAFLKERPDLAEGFHNDEGASIRGAGQVVGMIKAILPVQALIRQMVVQAGAILPWHDLKAG